MTRHGSDGIVTADHINNLNKQIEKLDAWQTRLEEIIVKAVGAREWDIAQDAIAVARRLEEARLDAKSAHFSFKPDHPAPCRVREMLAHAVARLYDTKLRLEYTRTGYVVIDEDLKNAKYAFSSAFVCLEHILDDIDPRG